MQFAEYSMGIVLGIAILWIAYAKASGISLWHPNRIMIMDVCCILVLILLFALYCAMMQESDKSEDKGERGRYFFSFD